MAPWTMSADFLHHGRVYSRLVHIVFQLCWYVPVAHHPVVYIFLCSSVGIKQGGQILEHFHCLHFFFLNVESLVFSGHCTNCVFPLLSLNQLYANVSLRLLGCNSTSALLCYPTLHSVTLKLQIGYPSSKMHTFYPNSATATQFGAAIFRVILLPTVASLVYSLSCTFCKFIIHRHIVGIFSF